MIEKITLYLIYDVILNANREFFVLNYNNTVLKYYRVIEMIKQFTFFKSKIINTQNLNYTLIPENVKEKVQKKTR